MYEQPTLSEVITILARRIAELEQKFTNHQHRDDFCYPVDHNLNPYQFDNPFRNDDKEEVID